MRGATLVREVAIIVQADSSERALAVFDAFLRYARGTVAPGNGRTLPPRSASAPPVAAGGAREAEPDLDGETQPSLTLPRPGVRAKPMASSEFDHQPTRISQLSATMASTLTPLPDDTGMWDEPTRERPDVMDELLRARASGALGTSSSGGAPLPFDTMHDAIPEPQSVIVDEDAMLTEPHFGNDRPGPRHGGAESRAEQFVAEMTVLIKYGHAGQVSRELERWMRTFPDELMAHVLLGEFELARVDASSGLERLFAIASRALDRGEHDVAQRVLERALRDAPGDVRINALRERLGQA